MARARRSTRKGMRRRTARRAYSGLRRRRSTTRRRRTRRRASPKGAGSRIYDIVKNASGYLEFANQITAKDYADLSNTNYKNEDIATKAKIFSNIVLGRLTGMTPFKSGNLYGSEDIPFTINPNGLVNKWTGLGVAGLIYKNLPIKQLPQKSKVGAVSKRLLLGGAIGGLFDPPMNSTTTSSSPKVLGVTQQNRSATMQRGIYSPSSDSVGGSFN